MSDLPFIVSSEEDFLIHLIAIPAGARVRELKEAAASLVVGAHIPDRPMSVVKIRKIDQTAALPDDAKVEDAGLTAMDWLHLFYDAEPAAGAAP